MTGAATVMWVIGALAILAGTIFIVAGPEIVPNGYEEDEFTGDKDVSAAGQQIRTVGWALAGLGIVLVLIGTGVRVSGRSRPY